MSDRYNALTVVLERDIRDDDAENLISAIKQLRGVASVKPNVVNFEHFIAHERARQELVTKLMDVLRPDDAQ